MFKAMGSPTYHNSFSLLGLSVLKPSFYKFMMTASIPATRKMVYGVYNHLTLVNSSFALDDPIPLPPNIIPVGFTVENKKEEDWAPDLK